MAKNHEYFMGRSLSLARLGAGWVHPNPLVGSCLVHQDSVVGEGFHAACGEAHAEVMAIHDAISKGFTDFENSTLYVNLEPCCHQGKTPPCTVLLIQMNIPHVVCGIRDPNKKVSGKGIAQLRSAGIQVTEGILARECALINEHFFTFIQTHKPFFLLKSAISLDGKIATASGESKWISCRESREETHKMRHEYTAVLTGIGTVLADDPLLNVRLFAPSSNASFSGKISHPTRLVADTHLRIPPSSKIVQSAKDIPLIIFYAEESLFFSNREKDDKKKLLAASNVTLISLPLDGEHLSLDALVREAAAMEIDSVLVESGGSLCASLIQKNSVNRIRMYVAPTIIGGNSSPGPIGALSKHSLAECPSLQNMSTRICGTDVVIEGDFAVEGGSPCLPE